MINLASLAPMSYLTHPIVGKFYVAVGIKKYVVQLQVTVDDAWVQLSQIITNSQSTHISYATPPSHHYMSHYTYIQSLHVTLHLNHITTCHTTPASHQYMSHYPYNSYMTSLHVTLHLQFLHDITTYHTTPTSNHYASHPITTCHTTPVSHHLHSKT